jgi:protein-tyrosine phosphatase
VIDLHCHLLPGIDDGPATMAEAVEMARLAVANGITESRVTPHLHVGRWQNDLSTIPAAVASYRDALAAAGVPLRISFAAEVRASHDIVRLVEAGQVPFLGRLEDYDVLLLEMPHSHVPAGIEKLISWLLGRNIRPMIAHPERNRDILRDGAKVLPLVRAGCLLQLTADAVAGEFGPEAAKRSAEFLEQGWVSVLASDAHDTSGRPPRLVPGRDAAARVIGAHQARALVEDNPARIVQSA